MHIALKWFADHILGIWAVCGPLVGIGLGQFLARRWNKQHWTNDNARQECRELLSTIANTFSVFLRYHAFSDPAAKLVGPHDAAEMRELESAERASLEIFYSRLFISDQLNKLKIRDRWIGAMNAYAKDHDGPKFAQAFGTIAREIRGIAANFIE